MTAPSRRATGESAPGRGVFPWRRAGVVAAACAPVAIWALTARVARVYAVSSDDATGMLEAAAVLSGNLLLRGWWLSGASFAAIDLPFYVAATALWGPQPSLLRDVPVTIYTTAIAAAALLARGHRRRGWWAALGVAAVLVLLGLPAGGLAEFVTKGYIRVGTTLGLFAALLALDLPAGRRASTVRVAIFAVLLALTILSDPYALYVGAPAILIVCLLGAGRVNSYETIRVGHVSLAVLCAAAAAAGLSWLIERLGGYHVSHGGPTESLVRRDLLQGVIQSAVTLVACLPDLYRCGLPADITAKSVLLSAGCLIGPALLIFALVRGCPISSRRRHAGTGWPSDFVSDVLWFSAVLAVAAFLTNSTWKDRATMRYMIPFVLAGAALTGRVLADRVRSPRTPIVALVLLGLAHAGTVCEDLQAGPPADPAEALANWLDARGLRHGYGPFWDASIVTASSRGRVAVRPVWVRAISPETHRIEPMRWMADDRWFSEGPVTFVVFEPGPGGNYQFGVDEWICTRSFGHPKSRYAMGPYIVLVWDNDLGPLLSRESPR